VLVLVEVEVEVLVVLEVLVEVEVVISTQRRLAPRPSGRDPRGHSTKQLASKRNVLLVQTMQASRRPQALQLLPQEHGPPVSKRRPATQKATPSGMSKVVVDVDVEVDVEVLVEEDVTEVLVLVLVLVVEEVLVDVVLLLELLVEVLVEDEVEVLVLVLVLEVISSHTLTEFSSLGSRAAKPSGHSCHMTIRPLLAQPYVSPSVKILPAGSCLGAGRSLGYK
jgi:hypothetical protein